MFPIYLIFGSLPIYVSISYSIPINNNKHVFGGEPWNLIYALRGLGDICVRACKMQIIIADLHLHLHVLFSV